MPEVGDNETIAEKRHRQRRIAAALGGLELSCKYNSMNIPAHFTDTVIYADKYGDVGTALYLNFYQQTEAVPGINYLASRGSLYGARVITKILSYMPPAYVAFCQTSQTTPSATTLGETMRTQTNIIDQLANTHARINRMYETALGLKGVPIFPDRSPFQFRASSNGLPGVEIDTQYEQQIVTEIDRRTAVGDLEPYDPRRTCPARGQLLRQFWLAAVVECETNPDLFAADIETALAAA